MVSRLMKTARRDLEKGAKTPMHGKGTGTPPEIRTALITKEIAEIQEGSVYSASIFDEFLFRFTAKKIAAVAFTKTSNASCNLHRHCTTRNSQRALRRYGWRYSVDVSEQKKAIQVGVGLCADCRFMRLIESDRGSTFYLCERSATDAKFPKYPRLPVLRCVGYEPYPAKAKSYQE